MHSFVLLGALVAWLHVAAGLSTLQHTQQRLTSLLHLNASHDPTHRLDSMSFTFSDAVCIARQFATPTRGWRDQLRPGDASSQTCAATLSQWSLAPVDVLPRLNEFVHHHAYASNVHDDTHLHSRDLLIRATDDGDLVLGELHARWYVQRVQHDAPDAPAHPPIRVINVNVGDGDTVELLEVAPQSHVSACVLAFRHQENDGSDLWEAMGLWGRDFSHLSLGGWLQPGTLLSGVASLAQSAIRWTRERMGWSYVQHARTLARAVHAAGECDALIFTGYSMGGAFAQLAAIDLDAPAVVVAANGVLDIVHHLYGELAPDKAATAGGKIFNVADASDITPRMDCQLGTLCLLPPLPGSGCEPLPSGAGTRDTGLVEPDEAECASHRDFVYGPAGHQLLQRYEQNAERVCIEHGDALRRWNAESQFCSAIKRAGAPPR